MSLLGILLQLIIAIFNKLTPDKKRIFFDVNNQYQIEMNVSSMSLKKLNSGF